MTGRLHDWRTIEEFERRVVEVLQFPCPQDAEKRHTGAVKLSDGSVVPAVEAIAEIEDDGVHVHYTLVPPEGAPAYEDWQRTGYPVELQVRPCRGCGVPVLFA